MFVLMLIKGKCVHIYTYTEKNRFISITVMQSVITSYHEFIFNLDICFNHRKPSKELSKRRNKQICLSLYSSGYLSVPRGIASARYGVCPLVVRLASSGASFMERVAVISKYLLLDKPACLCWVRADI